MEGANAKYRDESGWTALMYAIKEGHMDVVTVFLNALQSRYNPEQIEEVLGCNLIVAAHDKQHEILSLLFHEISL